SKRMELLPGDFTFPMRSEQLALQESLRKPTLSDQDCSWGGTDGAGPRAPPGDSPDEPLPPPGVPDLDGSDLKDRLSEYLDQVAKENEDYVPEDVGAVEDWLGRDAQREADIERFERKKAREAEEDARKALRDSPAMPVIAEPDPEPHRDRMASLYWAKLGQVASEMFAAVARVVGPKEIESTPAAKEAMDREWKKLADKSCWLEKKVREYRDVAAEAKHKNVKAHFGKIFEICSVKGDELPDGLALYGHPDSGGIWERSDRPVEIVINTMEVPVTRANAQETKPWLKGKAKVIKTLPISPYIAKENWDWKEGRGGTGDRTPWTGKTVFKIKEQNKKAFAGAAEERDPVVEHPDPEISAAINEVPPIDIPKEKLKRPGTDGAGPRAPPGDSPDEPLPPPGVPDLDGSDLKDRLSEYLDQVAKENEDYVPEDVGAVEDWLGRDAPGSSKAQREADIERFERKKAREAEEDARKALRDSPAMPVIAEPDPEPHRDRMASLYWAKLGQVASEMFAAVARVVGPKEIESTPAAKEAMDREWKKLADKSCWLEKKVREYRDVAAEAKHKNVKAHFGKIFEICSVKGDELPDGHPQKKLEGS
ncbi:GIP, partial [Symbiodinium natans]